MAALIGFNPEQVDTALTGGKTFGLGDAAQDHAGKEYVYVKASAAISQYDVVTYDETYNTTVAPVTTTNGVRGDKLGVAPVAIASGSYGWLQIYGPCVINVAASCVPNVELTLTSVAGVLDDATTASLDVADGIVTTAASASAAASKAAILNYPQVGRTL